MPVVLQDRTNTYVCGLDLGDRLIAERGTALTYFAADGLGSTSLIMRVGGSAVRVRYAPFGEIYYAQIQGETWNNLTNASGTNYLYTGQRRIGAPFPSGIYYYGSRFYSPVFGQFLSPDTIVPEPGNPQSLNRYSYVMNNPLTYNDPMGYCGLCDFAKDAAGTIVDVASGAGSQVGSAAKWGAQKSWAAGKWGYHHAATPVYDNMLIPAYRALWEASQSGAAFVSDYASDKSQDVATYAALNEAAPQSFLQNTLALGISMTSVGNRRTGDAGYVLYENCKGSCALINRLLGKPPAYTPGFIGFAPRTVDDATFIHENRHHIQSLVTGPAYLPFVAFEAARAATICGATSECIHRESVVERDAAAAVNKGLFYVPGW
jgi:RHS repeat-associated protein